MLKISTLSKADSLCSYLPVISTVKGTVDLICRVPLLCFSQEMISNRWYFSHLQVTKVSDSFLSIVPVLGNAVLYYKAMRACKAYRKGLAAQNELHELSMTAKQHYDEAAELGHPEAMLLCTLWSTSNREKEEWFLKAALMGIPEAMFQLGLEAERNEFYRDAYLWFERASREQFRPAMDHLGILYANGRIGRLKNGTPDYETAAYWFQKGASLKSVESMQQLVILYEENRINSTSSSSSLERAAEWRRKAEAYSLSFPDLV